MEILSTHIFRRANIVGIDHEIALKKNLPIVSAITSADLPDRQYILLVINKDIHNETANHSFSSEFQLREFGVSVVSICHRHGRTWQMKIADNINYDQIILPLDLDVFMVNCTICQPMKKLCHSGSTVYRKEIFH